MLTIAESSDVGGSLQLNNQSKASSDPANANFAPNWKLYNMTGLYGNGFEIWNYPNNGNSIRRFKIQDDGTTILAMNGGNVGIGTDPLAKLHVSGGNLAVMSGSIGVGTTNPSAGLDIVNKDLYVGNQNNGFFKSNALYFCSR